VKKQSRILTCQEFLSTVSQAGETRPRKIFIGGGLTVAPHHENRARQGIRLPKVVEKLRKKLWREHAVL